MQVIAHFDSYNKRRYSLPWVCQMTPDGKYDFKSCVGTFSDRDGNEGDLVVFDPIPGVVYGYGQKDHRGRNTIIRYAKWDDERFVPCNKLGFVNEENMQ